MTGQSNERSLLVMNLLRTFHGIQLYFDAGEDELTKSEFKDAWTTKVTTFFLLHAKLSSREKDKST